MSEKVKREFLKWLDRYDEEYWPIIYEAMVELFADRAKRRDARPKE